jgi:predicted dehydrogenase
MKQVTQRRKDGRVDVIEVPAPIARPGWVLVANAFSVISAGTERAKVEMGEKSLLQKARARPDLVRKVVDRARVEGVRSAFEVARERLATLAPLGYSSAGTVLQVGTGVEGISPGDLVACGGADWANHAEVVGVPRNLVARVPNGVPLDAAAYTTVGAIALHGVRQSEAAIGERVGVIGLGLVGQLAARILVAAGCDVVGVDVDPRAVDLAAAASARTFMRDDPTLEAAVLDATAGLGLDSVLLCAAADSTDPFELASRIARERGRIVVVGDAPLGADRTLLYEKELEVRLSRSYGPGRYDREYEEHGRDLPAGYVRWTEQRNMQAFLDLIARGQVDPLPLTTHRFPIERAPDAYKLLLGKSDQRDERPFGILLEYASSEAPSPRAAVRTPTRIGPRIGLIGAGAFARATLLPALRRNAARLVAVASETGLGAADVADRFGFERIAGSAAEVLAADDVDAVVIATRHSSHGRLVVDAMRAGKHVFVEKPLAIEAAELEEIEAAYGGNVLMVGFNRRFAPMTLELRKALDGLGGIVLVARVNAGQLGRDHWLTDPAEGGRLIGEGCHFVDLLAHLAGSTFTSVYAAASPHPADPLESSDEAVATLRLANGSVASLVYSGDGDPRASKERIEAFGGGVTAVLDDFRRLELYREGKKTVIKRRGQDKGHDAQMKSFLDGISGRTAPPDAESYFASARATLALVESLRLGAAVDLRGA